MRRRGLRKPGRPRSRLNKGDAYVQESCRERGSCRYRWQSWLFAQAKPPGSLPGVFTFVSKADVEKVQTAIANGTPNDAPVRMVNMSNRFNLGVYTLNSPPSKPPAPGAPVMGFYHNDIAEVYLITSGNGFWRVGGELEDPKADDVNSHGVKDVRGPGVVGVLKGVHQPEDHGGRYVDRSAGRAAQPWRDAREHQNRPYRDRSS